MSRHSHPIRRASDNRRAKWRRLNAYQRRSAFDGSAALALAEETTPPLRIVRQRLRLVLCDGLLEIVGRVWRFEWHYSVRIGNRLYLWSEQKLFEFWSDYYRLFNTRGTAGDLSGYTAAPLLLLSAPTA